ncbi:hypothetical protein Godav_014663 [Gossypium davidsonii]|uniref:Uncharacterized protein n=2 Tax=Gossypium TaxID=3633 RepID=A0A7J8RKI1_GOSDV|nr:hypothetical protein [Gossypium davidsonii]MBA0649582.1 hypothetical protein [Gossypium klotzschianum]
MDLETENRIAAILLKEAAELKRQADKEGVHVYLQQPKVRGRPNSRFLTATVLGVQQGLLSHSSIKLAFSNGRASLANRAVEVNEMWRVRQKELELNDRLKGRSKKDTSHSRSYGDTSNSSRRTSGKHESDFSASCSSSKRPAKSSRSREDDEGLRDEEIEEFLQSRVKRGRGSIGSRMDETGPYLPTDSPGMLSTDPIIREHRVTLGPKKPPSLKSEESSSDEEVREHRRKKEKDHSKSSDKKHRRKHKSKERYMDKKKKRKEEKRSKHRK